MQKKIKKRHLTPKILEIAHSFSVITLTGPRQSGKTTLVRERFPDHEYLSLELPDLREFASSDPQGFFAHYRGRVILDEVQRVPDLFSYVQTLVDKKPIPGQFILTGSQNFLLMEKVSQSLAGRAAILHLLPFSLGEVLGRDSLEIENPQKNFHLSPTVPAPQVWETLWKGFYPPIHHPGLPATDWLGSYITTCLERDLRNLLNISDLATFQKFLGLCAGRTGQLLNFSSLGADAGVSHTTVRRWLSLLQTSFLIHLLPPYFENFGKRLVKSPKLYFLDSGLLCFLLGIRSPAELVRHPLRGAIFESFVVADILKNFHHRGLRPPLFFWRDSQGHEIDLLVDLGEKKVAIEIKSGETIVTDFFSELHKFQKIFKGISPTLWLIHGGKESYYREGVSCVSFGDV